VKEGKTGWPPGLLQDDDPRLSKWFAGRPGARRQVKELCMQRHPVQDLAYWWTELNQPGVMFTMISKYDFLASISPTHQKVLDELLAWAQQEAISYHEYNNGDT